MDTPQNGMKPSVLAETLEKHLIPAQQPTFISGSPGIGKSSIIQQVAKKTGRTLYDVRLSTLDPVDLRGLPVVEGGAVNWAIPSIWPKSDSDELSILLLDEINAAPLSVQAAAYQLVLDRRIGDYTLPAGCAVLAAGNLESDKAVVNRMSSALASRFVHIQQLIDINDWCKWAIGADILPEIIAFIRFRPELLHNFDPASKTFPCPRTWEFASKVVKTGINGAIELPLLSGTIGPGAAAELIAFLRTWRNLPSPDAILLNPSGADVPSDPATLYALCGSLARIASENNLQQVMTYTQRLPQEFNALLVSDVITRSPELQQTPAFIEWASLNNEVLI